MSKKTSTSAAIATGGGREDLHIHVGGGRENEIFSFKEELGMPRRSLAANKEGMVELFSSEDNSSNEEELVKQVNTVESSKGGGMCRLARIVMGGCFTWVPRPRRWPRHR